MSNKIVNIILLVFLFTLSTILVFMYNNVLGDLRESNLALERVDQSVLSIDGEVSEDDVVQLAGYELKQAIKYVDSIGKLRDILGKVEIYGDIQINNKNILTVDEINSLIVDNSIYEVSYDNETGMIRVVVV